MKVPPSVSFVFVCFFLSLIILGRVLRRTPSSGRLRNSIELDWLPPNRWQGVFDDSHHGWRVDGNENEFVCLFVCLFVCRSVGLLVCLLVGAGAGRPVPDAAQATQEEGADAVPALGERAARRPLQRTHAGDVVVRVVVVDVVVVVVVDFRPKPKPEAQPEAQPDPIVAWCALPCLAPPLLPHPCWRCT